MMDKRSLVILVLAALPGGGCLTEADWEAHNYPCEIPGETRCNGSVLWTCLDSTWRSKSCNATCKNTGQASCHTGGGKSTCKCGNTDPCSGVSCSGHGVCSGGTCSCNAGYTGAACNACAAGYMGYPHCVKCDCKPSHADKCVGSSKITQCDGCSLSTDSCSWMCSGKKSAGCISFSSGDECVCLSMTQDLLHVKATNTISPTLTFQLYDDTDKLHWSTHSFAHNQTIGTSIECTTGNVICYGAWGSGVQKGCGENCANYCSDCCFKCGPGTWNISVK